MTREEEIRHKAGSIVDRMVFNNVPSEICDSYYQGFIEGAKWADKTIIEKACDWLKNSLYDTQDNCGYKVVASFDSVDVNEFIDNFKKAMEE